MWTYSIVPSNIHRSPNEAYKATLNCPEKNHSLPLLLVLLTHARNIDKQQDEPSDKQAVASRPGHSLPNPWLTYDVLRLRMKRIENIQSLPTTGETLRRIHTSMDILARPSVPSWRHPNPASCTAWTRVSGETLASCSTRASCCSRETLTLDTPSTPSSARSTPELHEMHVMPDTCMRCPLRRVWRPGQRKSRHLVGPEVCNKV